MQPLDDVVKEFLVESLENLDRLDRSLVDLEQDPHDRENLASIFRTIHTIKGTCGFLGFGKLESVSHVGESLLSRMRDGELVLNAAITTGLLAMVDAIRRILAVVEATGGEPNEDYGELIAMLNRLNAPGQKPAAAPAATVVMAEAVAAPGPASSPVGTATDTTAPRPEHAPARATEEIPMEIEIVDARSSDERPTGGERRPAIVDTSLRVDVGLLDKLMNLVGELVLARNQILQFTTSLSDSAFIGATQRLNLVASELQEGVMKTRMQPIDNVWSKFPRVVRDLAIACGKQVRIEMVGKDTELDKTIIEAIKDPLTHVVRNSADHGIETPSARIACGKPPEGVVRLRAFHEGGQINIEISDDGAGIDPEKVRRKAVDRSMVSAEQAARMSDHEALRLIFLPGFSTAEKITNVSGRGVGMDVVKTNIEKIGGTVDIQSTLGQGTTLKIRIPLTLAIIPALMVSTGGEVFAIPQVSLLELVRLEGEHARAGIERIGAATFYRLRGNLLPLVQLHSELNLASQGDPGIVNIVVLKADDRQFGLVVDSVNDTEEIVVKPLGRQLKSVQVFAGATIMGDGHVALILDATRLAQQAHVLSADRDRKPSDRQGGPLAHETADAQTWMLFQVNGTERMAMPLHLVARLEEFATADIERSGGQEVVQYRGEILPLVSLTRFFGGTANSESDPRQVIVFSDHGRSVGLVVDRILDIVTETITPTRSQARSGILGAAVIQQRVTDLLDVAAIVRHALPESVSEPVAA
ncbi:MAG: chemotaxis protein CheW [Vicinamibacterales bacterium]|jgi:two-component system chemotaxis sensor kinase CheA